MASRDRKRYFSSIRSLSSKKQRYVSIEETEDRINQLPESLLLQILSFLRTKDAPSTCLVAKRWVNLWTLVDSFNFSPIDFVKHQNSNLSFVEYVLARSITPKIKKLKLELASSRRLDNWQPLINQCLSFAVERNVENVVIWSREISFFHRLHQSFFACSSLIALAVSRVWITFDGVIEWKSLKSLKLEWSWLSNDDIVNLLAGCPALETLELSEVSGSLRLEIKSLKLKRFIFAGCHYNRIESLEIFAPYLQHLEISGNLDNKCRLVDVSSVVNAKLAFSISCTKDIMPDSDEEFDDEEDSCYQSFVTLIKDNLEKLSNATELIIGTWITDALCRLQLIGMSLPELKCKYLTLFASFASCGDTHYQHGNYAFI